MAVSSQARCDKQNTATGVVSRGAQEGTTAPPRSVIYARAMRNQAGRDVQSDCSESEKTLSGLG